MLRRILACTRSSSFLVNLVEITGKRPSDSIQKHSIMSHANSLEDQIKLQGDVVRNLKQQKADKDKVFVASDNYCHKVNENLIIDQRRSRQIISTQKSIKFR